MDKNKGKPIQEGKKGKAQEKQSLLAARWAEASNWNPDDFETHPARRKFIAGKKPIPAGVMAAGLNPSVCGDTPVPQSPNSSVVYCRKIVYNKIQYYFCPVGNPVVHLLRRCRRMIFPHIIAA